MPERLRVLMVDSEATWRGGEAQLHLLMRGLVDSGCDVALAAPPASAIRRRSEALGVVFHPVAFAGGLDMAAALRLRAVLRRGRYDVVHAHASHAHGATSLACAAWPGRPWRVVSRRVDFAISRRGPGGWKYRRGADLYLAISSGVRDALLAGGVDAGRIRMVPSGIDLEKFDAVGDGSRLREEFGIGEGTPVVGNIAALAPHKAQADLLRAAAVVSAARADVRFFVVGEGRLRAELEALARSLGVDGRVTFTGFRDDALEFLRVFDVFAMSSRLEGLGTSIMDAQAARVPVVATNTGGIPDVVEDGVSGILVPPADPGRLADGILRMLSDERLRRGCVETAFERSRGYDYRRMVYKTLDAYRELCGGVAANRTPSKGGRGV